MRREGEGLNGASLMLRRRRRSRTDQIVFAGRSGRCERWIGAGGLLYIRWVIKRAGEEAAKGKKEEVVDGSNFLVEGVSWRGETSMEGEKGF